MNKNIFFLSVLAAASAHADVEVAAGFKLYGTLDQAYTTQSVSSANATRKIYSNTGFLRRLPPVNLVPKVNAP